MESTRNEYWPTRNGDLMAPPIFVVSLINSSHRPKISARLAELGMDFQFIDAFDGYEISATELQTIYDDVGARKTLGRPMGRGEIGCALSHRKIYEMMCDQNIESAIILEDDAIIKSEFREFYNALSILPHDIEIISLYSVEGVVRRSPRCKSGQASLHRVKSKTTGSVGYFVRRAAAAKLMMANCPVTSVADWPVDYRQLAYYLVLPMPIGHSKTNSLLEAERQALQIHPRPGYGVRILRVAKALTFLQYLQKHDQYRGLTNYFDREIGPRLPFWIRFGQIDVCRIKGRYPGATPTGNTLPSGQQSRKIALNSLVSILIPTYDRKAYVFKAIGSAQAQTYHNIEILVHDDGSADGTWPAILELARQDPRVKPTHSPNNLGIAATRNTLIAIARGDYISWLDSDDLIHPEKIARQVQFLKNNEDIVAVGTGHILIDEKGTKELGRRLFDAKPKHPIYLPDFCHASIMYKADLLRRIFPLRLVFSTGEDVDLLLRVAEHGKIANLPDYLYYYRQHANQISRKQADGNALAMASRLFRITGRRDPADNLDMCEYSVLSKILEDRDFLLSYTGTLNASHQAVLRASAVHVIIHAARRIAPRKERLSIYAVCFLGQPIIFIRLVMRWLSYRLHGIRLPKQQ